MGEIQKINPQCIFGYMTGYMVYDYPVSIKNTHKENVMNAQNKTSLGKAAAIFVGMAIVFAALIVAANSASNSFAQLVLVSTGSAMLGSGVIFFLISAAK